MNSFVDIIIWKESEKITERIKSENEKFGKSNFK